MAVLVFFGWLVVSMSCKTLTHQLSPVDPHSKRWSFLSSGSHIQEHLQRETPKADAKIPAKPEPTNHPLPPAKQQIQGAASKDPNEVQIEDLPLTPTKSAGVSGERIVIFSRSIKPNVTDVEVSKLSEHRATLELLAAALNPSAEIVMGQGTGSLLFQDDLTYLFC